MPIVRLILDRYWSLAAAILLPVMEIVAESFVRLGEYDEVLRAILSVVCLALLVHSWFTQRKYTSSQWRLGFFTLLLSLVALGPVWLGLNVIRYYSYAGEQQYTLYGVVVHLQDVVVWLAETLCAVVSLWVIVDLVRWMKRQSFLRG